MVFAFQTPLDERVPMPLWIMPAYATLLSSSLLLPKTIRIAFVLPLAVWLLSQFPRYTFISFGVTYLVAIPLVGLLWQWVDMAILNEPSEAFFQVSEDPAAPKDLAKSKAEGFMPDSIVGKLIWSNQLLTTNRGIGWNWKVKNVPAEPVQTKSEFLFWTGIRFLFTFCMTDACYYVMNASPYAGWGSRFEYHGSPWQHRFAIELAGALWLRYFLSAGYEGLAFVGVGSGLFSQSAFPPLMGNMLNATTVRNFWGREWHQLVRRNVSFPGDIIRNAFGIKRGTILSRYSQLYMGFIFSALLHAAGGYSIGRKHLGELWWFVSQAVAITIEDIAMHYGKKAGITYNPLVHLIGMIWVIFQFYITLEYSEFAPRLLSVGFAADIPEFSVTQTAVNLADKLGFDIRIWNALGGPSRY